jgi:hypothetical protein
MSDSEPTPRGTARVNSERFPTELAAVWYAANYYYQSSYKRGREYIGSVFRQADGKYGVTVRSDGGFAQSTIRIGDVPRGAIPTAVWHTHIPSSAMAKTTFGQILMAILTTGDADWDQFSDADRDMVDKASEVSREVWGQPISMYLCTATVIRRYRPGLAQPDKSWDKDPPSKFRW